MIKDLSGMSYAELVELTQHAEKLMKEQRAEALENVVAKIKELAESHKLSLEEIVAKLNGGKTSTPKTTQSSNVKPQFAHPENPGLTWSGRGRTPSWVLDYVGTDKLDRIDPTHQAKLDEIRM